MACRISCNSRPQGPRRTDSVALSGTEQRANRASLANLVVVSDLPAAVCTSIINRASKSWSSVLTNAHDLLQCFLLLYLDIPISLPIHEDLTTS
jgi:hypothetical protein